MFPCYKGQISSNEKTQRDFKQQELNHTLGKKIEGFGGKGKRTWEI